jgi:hypothetical protein
MSYWDIASMALDTDLNMRVQASAAQELPLTENPYTWTADHILNVAAQPGWADSWASAIASNVSNPGRDPGVITDGQILSGVQTVISGSGA